MTDHPTDRRAEAEADKKHGPKCWGRTSYSDEVAHCYCGDTPPSAGQDAGLVDHAKALRALCNGHPHAKIAWPHRELHGAAAVLEAAAEREEELRDSLSNLIEEIFDAITEDGEPTDTKADALLDLIELARSTWRHHGLSAIPADSDAYPPTAST